MGWLKRQVRPYAIWSECSSSNWRKGYRDKSRWVSQLCTGLSDGQPCVSPDSKWVNVTILQQLNATLGQPPAAADDRAAPRPLLGGAGVRGYVAVGLALTTLALQLCAVCLPVFTIVGIVRVRRPLALVPAPCPSHQLQPRQHHQKHQHQR